MAFPWGPLVSGGLGLISGLFGNKQSSSNIDKQIEAQINENRAQREWNLKLANLANQWSIEQWNRENAYNTPSAVKKRLTEAGLNTDLMYGGGVGNMQAANSPAVTPADGGQPADMSALGLKPTVNSAIQQSLQNALTAAQVKAVNAQANKTTAETAGAESENIIKAAEAAVASAKTSGELKLMGINIKLSEQQHAFLEKANEQQLKQLEADVRRTLASIEQINTSVKEVQARIGNMTFDQVMRSLEYELNKARTGAEVKAKLASAGYTAAQTRAIVQKLPYELAMLVTSANIAQATESDVISDTHSNAMQNLYKTLEAEAKSAHDADKRAFFKDTSTGARLIKNSFSVLEYIVDHTLGAIKLVGE